MRDWIYLATWSVDTASTLVALAVWIGATIGLLSLAARQEHGLWEIRKSPALPSLSKRPRAPRAASRP